MSGVIGWAGLILMVYFFIALFFADAGATRALVMAAATGGDFESEARGVLARSHRTRVRWIKEHAGRLPGDARTISERVVFWDTSCWAALVALFVLYSLNFFAS